MSDFNEQQARDFQSDAETVEQIHDLEDRLNRSDVQGVLDESSAATGVADEKGHTDEGEAQVNDSAARIAELEDQVARGKADLYNLNQEYSNYVRRSKAEVPKMRDAGRAEVLTALGPVFDDIFAARQHGELEGPFASIVKKLEDTLSTSAKFEVYGEAGEPFDPQVHEALMAEDVEGVTEPTVGQVLQPGYKMGERVLRPARVIVHNPKE